MDENEYNEVLSNLELKSLENRKLNELSEGQQQSIARSLIKNFEIILTDEPTRNLDVSTAEKVFQYLNKLSKSKLVIVTSHDMKNVAKYAKSIIEMSKKGR